MSALKPSMPRSLPGEKPKFGPPLRTAQNPSSSPICRTTENPPHGDHRIRRSARINGLSLSDEEKHEQYEIIHSSADHLLAIITMFLTFRASKRANCSSKRPKSISTRCSSRSRRCSAPEPEIANCRSQATHPRNRDHRRSAQDPPDHQSDLEFSQVHATQGGGVSQRDYRGRTGRDHG